MSDQYLGIDLGGTVIKGCLVDASGKILTQEQSDTNDTGEAKWLHEVKDLYQKFKTQAGEIKGIGLAAPGIASPDGRSIANIPGRMEGLEGLNWTNELNAGIDVHVLNDAHAYTLGEAWIGAGRNCQHLVLLTLGTGVGGGIIANGELLLGHRQRTGHLGHVSLNPEGPLDSTLTPGSLEDEIGEVTIEARSNGRYKNTYDLIKDMRQGDSEAKAIWQKSIRALAAALTSFINSFDPEKIIIGGGISNAGDDLLHPLQERLNEIEWRLFEEQVPVTLAELGSWGGAVGAAKQAINQSI